MKNLLAITIFGHTLQWEVEDALFWLMVAQVALVLLMVIVFAVLIHRVGRDKTVVLNAEKKTAPERKLLGITLDTASVQRKFALGEAFNCGGLVAIAHYSDAPVYESITDATIKTAEQYAAETAAAKDGAPAAQGEAAPATAGLVVIAPAVTGPGKAFVTVLYGGMKAVYAIEFGEKEVEAAPVAEPVRTLLSITLDTAMVQREFHVGEEFNCAGLLVTANYDLEPTSEGVSEFEVDAPDLTAEGKPTVTVRYGGMEAAYVISVTAAEEEEPVVVAEPEPEPEPVETVEEVAAAVAEPEPVEELSEEGGTLRYNRSFTARMIQSSDDVKSWYTDLKNELLSYRKAKARMSWKREGFRVGSATVARFSFRGKTLCLYLALDVNDYADTKYLVEDASENASYVDTPLMYRIKNAKRARYAADLIAAAMEKVGAPRIERESVDYYLPYEGIVELIHQGLVKRTVKSKKDEAIFLQGKTDAEEPAEEVAEAPAEEPAPVEEVAATEEPVEEPAPAEEPVEEVAATEEPVAPAEEVSAEEPVPAEEPAPVEEPVPVEEAEIEELTEAEKTDVESYTETPQEYDEEGIPVVGVMFRHRGRKVYWFDSDGKEWKKGEIALYKSDDNPPQEVIVVDVTKRAPSKLHLPLKSLCKVERRK